MYCAFLPTSQRSQTEHEGIHVCLVPLGSWNLWVRIMYSYSICFQRSELFQKKSQYFCSICFCARISKSNIKSHSITGREHTSGGGISFSTLPHSFICSSRIPNTPAVPRYLFKIRQEFPIRIWLYKFFILLFCHPFARKIGKLNNFYQREHSR